MKRKVNTICFIFLFLFLISAVSAADSENETLKTISKIDADDNAISKSGDEQILQKSNAENKLEHNIEKTNISATTKVTKQKVNLKAPNVNMYYEDGHKFSVTLTDKNKKPISNAKLKISMNNRTYTTVTDKNGIGVLGLHLKSRTYNVVTTFDGTGIYEKASVKSTVTIKSTIKCSDFTKYFKNPTAYTATFYDKKGNILKNVAVKFQINSKTYSSKTNNNGVAKLNINLKPNKLLITSINPKTGEQVDRLVTIKSLIETENLIMDEGDGSKFHIRVLDSTGKAAPYKKLAITLNGKTYTPSTDKNGKKSFKVWMKSGTYFVTTEVDELKAINKITVNKIIKASSFKHVTSIPNYVNVTLPYVYPNAKYSLKTGVNGTVKMPKIEIFTVTVGSKTYHLATGKTNNGDTLTMEEKSYLITFDGGVLLSCANKDSLTFDGIMITKKSNMTEIEYRSKTKDNVELFGFYADKGLENSEILTYMRNDEIKAKVSIQTQYYDETGVKYSLAKHYKRANADFAYYEITNHISNPIIFTNTGKPVTFGYFERNIVGYPSKEDITTRFFINGKEELEKTESISYGLSEKYRKAYGFEVLQAYTIMTEKITQKTLEDWIGRYSPYSNRFGVMNVYGMHLASLETTWLADELANEYSKEFNVTWSRSNALTILGGINLDDTYLNILNADMGMAITGNQKNVIQFRLINSINLPNIEDYVLTPVSERFMSNKTNSFDNIFSAINNSEFSMTQLGELLYLFSKDNSAIILNCTSGVASVIHSKNNSTYKGSSVATSHDCCSVGIIPQDIIAGIRNSIKLFSPGIYLLSDKLDKIHPFSVMAYMGIKFLLEHTLEGASSASMSLFSVMALIQTGGTVYRDLAVNEKEWHKTMDKFTFTRPGYLQGKKIYNIPNKEGGYDYIEVKINEDLTLDRNNAKYISDGKTKLLTKQETYQYFCEDYWTPFSMPTKYWDDSWK